MVPSVRPRCQRQHSWPFGGDPQRRRGGGHGDRGLGKAQPRPVQAGRLTLEHPLERLDCLFETAHPMVKGQVHGVELRPVPSRAQPENEATGAHVGKRRGFTGELPDVTKSMTENEASEGNLGRGRSDLGKADHRFMREHTATRSLYEDVVHHPH